MFFKISLYIALAIFGIGMIYRISTWFIRSINPGSGDTSFIRRFLAAVKGIIGTIFSRKILTLLKVFVLDVIFQRRILKEDFLRWLMHICIFFGFMLLLLMHALEDFISVNIFQNYYSTVNPFMFLRDLFGLIAIIGILIAIYRRLILKVPRLSSNAMDVYLIIIIAVIMISGIFLEGLKITSYSDFKRMVSEYGLVEDESEAKALESYWVKEFAVISPDKGLKFDDETLSVGEEAHNLSCVECHSNPKSAFLGYSTAAAINPVARSLDQAGGVNVLLYIHFISVFLALAYLPFSKMLHIIATPVILLLNSVMEEGKSDPLNIATKQVIELDACTHCGTCSLRCSVLAAYEMRGNEDILPSEKMTHIKKLISGRKLSDKELKSLQEGIYICTNCDRCTVVCPSGINLRDLWFRVREELIHRGYPVPQVISQLSFYRGLMKEKLDKEYYSKPVEEAKAALTSEFTKAENNGSLSLKNLDKEFIEAIGMPGDAGTYSYCFTCSTCTSSCPVVACYEKPMETLGLVPHQIIHSAALGLKDIAIGSSMLWDCLTCYKCQENCPQGVRVAEVIYRLKNIAVTETADKRESEGAKEV